MSAVTDFQTALEAVRAAIAAGNYSTARRQVAIARAALAGIPNVGNDATSVSWREDLNSLVAALDDLEAEDGARKNTIQFSKVTFKEPS